MSVPAESNLSSSTTPISAWTPFKHIVFRMLWVVWLTTNVCMWMNDVTAAWLMTSLTTSPIMVALVQTAATLPVFLFGVPSGALADIFNRRRYFLSTQIWLAAVAAVLCVVSVTETLSAPLLLVFTFLNGVGLATRWPVFAAIVPEMVPRQQLPAALALNGVAVNISRIVGPAIAGAVITAAGSAYVFLLNAALSITTAIIVLRWRRKQKVSALPSEPFFGAIRVGLQYVRQSPTMHSVLAWLVVFFVNSTALIALLPLVTKHLHGGDARSFTLLLAAIGVGAIIGGISLPHLRHIVSRDRLVRSGTLLHAVAILVTAFSPNLLVAVPATLVAGVAWIVVADSLTVAAQMALPNWVKARGMSIFHVAMMGGTALGAALWGQAATLTDVRTGLVLAATAAVAGLLIINRFKVGGRAEEDLTPGGVWKTPAVAIPIKPRQGPVLITIDYRIDPARATEFIALMHEIRRSRLRSGVLTWDLFRDTAEPGHYIEHIVDPSWTEHLRRHERMTASDYLLRERQKAFHIEDAPVVVRYIAEPVK